MFWPGQGAPTLQLQGTPKQAKQHTSIISHEPEPTEHMPNLPENRFLQAGCNYNKLHTSLHNCIVFKGRRVQQLTAVSQGLLSCSSNATGCLKVAPDAWQPSNTSHMSAQQREGSGHGQPTLLLLLPTTAIVPQLLKCIRGVVEMPTTHLSCYTSDTLLCVAPCVPFDVMHSHNA
jgi:hypothetical protein